MIALVLVRAMSEHDEHIHPEAAVAPGYLAIHAARVFNRLVDAALRPYGLSLSLIGPIMLPSWSGVERCMCASNFPVDKLFDS
ncbi:Hypothetical protein NGAL_HAMBI490_39670 [Neorhizobium galegae bv. officinalis]|nr:Hypothetical protein NGAL_HAMBI490_39670 [Neorhizobium galegae bv. officinalis]